MRKTNPIPALMPIRRSAFPGGQIVQNEPNSARAGPRRTEDAERKANPEKSGGDAGADCAKQTQFGADRQGRPSSRPKALAMPPIGATRRTKPICSGRWEWASAVAKNSYDKSDTWRASAKQSQFPAGAGWDGATGAWDAGQSCGTRVMADWTRTRNLDEQSQSPAVRTGPVGRTAFGGKTRPTRVNAVLRTGLLPFSGDRYNSLAVSRGCR